MSKRRSSSRKSIGLNQSGLVTYLDSPVSSIKKSGNLVGDPRVIQNHVIVMNDCINKWNDDWEEGISVISNIEILMQQQLKSKKMDTKCMDDLQECSEKLNEICERMELQVKNLEQKKDELNNFSKYVKMNNSTPPAIFQSWPVTKFANVSRSLYEMYKEEMKLKFKIKEEICLCTNDDTIKFLRIAWNQQPYIERSVNADFECMLIEVGLSTPQKAPNNIN